MSKRIGLIVLLLTAMVVGIFLVVLNKSTQKTAQKAQMPIVASAVPAEAVAEAEVDEEDEATQNLALFFGHDDRAFIPAPYVQPYAAIGKLQTVAESHCTATLVAPDLAVTAAHCFLMQPNGLDQGKWFWAGYHQGKWQARYRIIGQVFNPKFRKGLEYRDGDVYISPKVSAYDIAWIKLQFVDGKRPQPMPVYAGKNADTLLARIQQYDSKVSQAGFAHDHNQQLTAHIGCQITSLVDDNTLEHRCDTLSGDSGSPLWLETKQGPQLIAVQSAAPDWFNRDQADNTAVTVLQLPKKP